MPVLRLMYSVTLESRCYLVPQMQVQIHCLISISWKMKLCLHHQNVAEVVDVCVTWHSWSKCAVTLTQLYVSSVHRGNAVITCIEFWKHVHDTGSTTGYPVIL